MIQPLYTTIPPDFQHLGGLFHSFNGIFYLDYLELNCQWAPHITVPAKIWDLLQVCLRF